MTHAIEIVQTNLFIGFPRRFSLFAHCAEVKRKIHPALVYVTAFVPKEGQSLPDLTKLPEGAGDQSMPISQSKENRRLPPCRQGRRVTHCMAGARKRQQRGPSRGSVRKPWLRT
jgi:hypothetical protein